ncbi:hypothetical protein E2I00_007726, partial [Balaenoptera physalus]
GNQELFPCEVCGRRFAADVLERHGPICRKLFNKKRKAFNSLKQRLQGTDIPTVQQHEDFINAIRSAKQCTLAIKEGRPLPPPPPPSINLDYIQCPYCMRRFNETAANRHINFCKDQSSRRVFDPAQAAAKLASRVQGRVQMSPEKGTTVTSAVGALLQNRALEASVVPTRPGLAVDPASGAKFRQGFTKSSKKRLTPRGQERGMIFHFDLEGYCPENTNLLPPVVQQTRHLKVLRSVFWELNAMFYAQVNQVLFRN